MHFKRWTYYIHYCCNASFRKPNLLAHSKSFIFYAYWCAVCNITTIAHLYDMVIYCDIDSITVWNSSTELQHSVMVRINALPKKNIERDHFYKTICENGIQYRIYITIIETLHITTVSWHTMWDNTHYCQWGSCVLQCTYYTSYRTYQLLCMCVLIFVKYCLSLLLQHRKIFT